MKISISNIAWGSEQDENILSFLKDNNISGLEIAPTRLVQETPYSNVEKSVEIVKEINSKYNLEISSMQSILFGKTENLFGRIEEREEIIQYLKKAVLYAKSINCKNLVFGCPKNRIMEDEYQYQMAIDIFKELGDFAYENGTRINMEPNPAIYGTNFLNTTKEAIQFVKDCNTKGLGVNLDIGTIIANKENIEGLTGNIKNINHVHISEPNLAIIEKRDIHIKLINLLKNEEYDGYISIEMKNQNDINIVKQIITYLKNIVK